MEYFLGMVAIAGILFIILILAYSQTLKDMNRKKRDKKDEWLGMYSHKKLCIQKGAFK